MEGSDIVAQVEPGSLLFGSITCGHTNQGLRAILAGLASKHAHLARNGKLDLEQIRTRDAAMADAVSKGLEWTVIRHEVRARWPEVIAIFSEAGNNSIGRPVSEVQGLVNLFLEARKTNEPDWQEIKQKVTRSLPIWKSEVPDLIAFAVAKSGGAEGRFLDWLKKFHAAFVPGGRRVHGSLYGALADFPFIYSAYAILAAAYTCPADKLKFGVCDWISAASVTRQRKKEERAKWTNVELILSKAAEFQICFVIGVNRGRRIVEASRPPIPARHTECPSCRWNGNQLPLVQYSTSP